jgi:hypothetical protein
VYSGGIAVLPVAEVVFRAEKLESLPYAVHSCSLGPFCGCSSRATCTCNDTGLASHQAIEYIFSNAGTCPVLGRGAFGLFCAPCVDFGFWVRLRFVLRSLALWSATSH